MQDTRACQKVGDDIVTIACILQQGNLHQPMKSDTFSSYMPFDDSKRNN